MREGNAKMHKWLSCLLLICLLAGCGFGESGISANIIQNETAETGTETKVNAESADMVAESADAEYGISASDGETEPEESYEPRTTSVTISFAGDCALGKLQLYGYEGTLNAYYDSYGAAYFMEGVQSVFAEDDFTLVNLECVLTDESDRVEKKYNIKGDPEYTSILTEGSIEGVSLGNNHSADYGEESLSDTQEALEAAGVEYAIDDIIGTYTTQDGVEIGFVSVNLLSQSSVIEGYLEQGIKDLKENGADIVVALCHWGIERQYYPIDYQRTMAHNAIDWGADAVIGCHPHVLQSMELYQGKVICYSLGNFCFGANKNPEDKDTMIYQQTFTFTESVDGWENTDAFDATIIPCSLSSVDSYNDYQPTILSGEDAQAVIDRLNEYSEPYSDMEIEEDGTIVIAE